MSTKVKVEKKEVGFIISIGKPRDWYTNKRVSDIVEVNSDFNNLGQKKLREKYFPENELPDVFTSSRYVWINGYYISMEFSDGSSYYFESTDNYENSLESRNPVHDELFGDMQHDEIFPDEMEKIYSQLG